MQFFPPSKLICGQHVLPTPLLYLKTQEPGAFPAEATKLQAELHANFPEIVFGRKINSLQKRTDVLIMGIQDKHTFGGTNMQNYIYPVSNNNENPSKKSYLRPLSSVQSINEAILDKVMPIHQVVRFANQAFENHTPVYVVIEEKLGPKSYTRTLVWGKFNSRVTPKRQVMFTTADKKVTYLLNISQILAIQLG
jgi:hypothetical protein